MHRLGHKNIRKKFVQSTFEEAVAEEKTEEEDMANRSKNLWKRDELKELTQISSAAKVNVTIIEDGEEQVKDDVEEQVKDVVEEQTKPVEKKKDEKTKKTKKKKTKKKTRKKKSKEKETVKENETMVDIPDLPLDELEEAAAAEPEELSVQDESGGSVVFGILGGGQAGGRLAESFYNLGYKKALAINTASHDLEPLKNIPESQKVLMSVGGSGGGAGKDMRVGERAADKYQQEIYERMQRVFGKVDRVLVCAGAGGGTGAGACFRLVETAKKYLAYLGVENVNSKVGVLLTLPTTGEATSPAVADNAHLIASKLSSFADAGGISPLIIFDNDKIKKMYPKLSVKQFWPTVNATVSGLFHMFNVLSNKPGDPTSFDPADYQRVLSSGGCMIMGFTTLKDYTDGTDVSKAIRSNLEKGLLCNGFEISTAKSAACIATASEDILEDTPGLMDSLETGFDTLANITGNATVFRGIYEVEKKKLVIYTMLTGLSEPTKRLNDLKKFQNDSVSKKTSLYD